MQARVVHIITKLELGGAQQNTLYTVRHLDRSRFSVALYCGDGGLLNDEAAGIPDLDFDVVPELVREVRPWKDLNALWQLRSILKDEVQRSGLPVIVHTHSSKAGVLGRWAAWLAGVPVIIHTYHGFGFNDYQSSPKRFAFLAAERVTAKITDYIIAVSQANLDKALKLSLADPVGSGLIRSGIRIDEFERADADKGRIKRELGVPEEAPLVLMVACLKPQKNPVDFVKMAEMVSARVPEARFAVAGDGELRSEMEEAVRARGLEDRVLLLGWRRDVPELLWASQVLVLTSLWEGLPRVYPQAMAASVPVVGTRVDGASEAVADGVNGWLVPPGDVNGLVDYVTELLKDPEAARALGEAGRRKVDEFDIDLMVRQQEELYTRLLSARIGDKRGEEE
ncbi:MAG: glycosyltransferase family 4 protein [bacterium]